MTVFRMANRMRHHRLIWIAIGSVLLGAGLTSSRADDVTPPTITAASATIAPTRNGDVIVVSVSATANEPARFRITCRYASSYLDFGGVAGDYYAFKTAAVGEHTAISQQPALAETDLQVVVGPRCYHSDTLTVHVTAVDTMGLYSEPYQLFAAPIEMPFPVATAIPVADTYRVATHWNGGLRPSEGNRATIADWAKPDLILCTPVFLFEGPQTAPDWDHWVERLRAEPGSNNVAVLGFTGITTVDHGLYPVQKRLFAFMQSLYNDVDENVLVHLTDGSLPTTVDSQSGRQIINIFNETARDTLAWFLAQEWNHSENRLPRVGLMFDVYELWTEYSVNDQYAPRLIDRDRDGIAMLYDQDELEGTRYARIEFLRSLRRHIAATSADPNVGRYFLIGANTVSGRSDAQLLAEVDFLLLEDVQCPPSGDTEYQIYDGEGCYWEHVRALPFHLGGAEYFRREFCPGIFYDNHLISSGIIPDPPDLSQAWLHLPQAMRTGAGGPFISPESQGPLQGEPRHPVHLEVFSLLFDHFYPIWHRQDVDDDWRRQYWHPSREGFADLRGLGRATSPLVRSYLENGAYLWRRQFESGLVEVVLADTSYFTCEAGDLFEFRVTVDGQILRQSEGWGSPTLESFFVAGWDSAGVGGSLRFDLTAFANEPVRWERSYRLGAADNWSEPVATDQRSATLAGYWDTGLAPRAGLLSLRLRGLDQTGLETDWAEQAIQLYRFGGFGVVIEDTFVIGTSYGLPDSQGEYAIAGRGEAAPLFAPPHYLMITGRAPVGFNPVEVRWHNSLGGDGTAEGTSVWHIPEVPLHRGTNVITIMCIDAHGTAQLGNVTKYWNYPGQPGQRR